MLKVRFGLLNSEGSGGDLSGASPYFGASMLGQLRNRRSGWARILTAMAVIAFAVRALTPVGYMLAPTEDGRFLTVTLCSQHGAIDVVLDRETGKFATEADRKQSDDDNNRDSSFGPCVFAASANFAPPAAAPAVLSMPVVPDAPTYGAESVFVGAGLAAPPPWATGPPQLI